KIAAVIESYFQGLDDLYVFSPKRMKNVVDDPEEVDVAFASISDLTSIFEFVQVRDRKNTEGRPWVEQVLGQRNALGINAGIMVSTDQFSQPAIQLASKSNIRLRLLLPETDENIKLWYKPNNIGIQSPIVEIDHCSVLAKVDDRILEFKADESKSLEDNILVPTTDMHKYRVISLARVFDVDVMHNETRQEDFLAEIPMDVAFRKATVAIEYEQPRLYLKVQQPYMSGTGNSEGILPIVGIVFSVRANRQFFNLPIAYRYKYLDAIKNESIAQAIIAKVCLENQQYYVSLVRHRIVGDNRNVGIGGAFFR
ncbi:MAG: restriction endonuclease, partial [Dehalococcoidia bacterium]|nr:restriction endonuclease [Dehalococcoidia bacterium]